MAGEFAKLIDEREVSRVTLSFEAAIENSFVSHPMRHMTHAEVKRRFEICASIFAKLRGELKWGITRALDRIPDYLNDVLSGKDWTPDKRQCWMPGDQS